MGNRLLSYRWKIGGGFITLTGVILAVFYIWFDFRLMMPVFAIFSSYLESKLFTTFTTNITDDLILLLLVSGLTLMVFSKEKTEVELFDQLRAKALVSASIYNMIFLVFSILFVYGSGFIGIMVFNLFSVSIFYLIIFYNLKRRKTNKFNRGNPT